MLVERAVQLDPGFVDAWIFLAVERFNLGDRERGIVDVTRAFELRDNSLLGLAKF